MSSRDAPHQAEHQAQHDVQARFCATLVDQWIRDGVRHAVIAPGSRSTPMALAFAERPELALHVFHDERSAAYAALGIGLVSARPAPVLCTSGTAAAHLHAAVIEAGLSHVPMIVLTADRPPELRDVGAPQTIDQVKLYGSAARWYHDPGVPVAGTAGTWRALARRCLVEALGARRGAVHLNLPFREPLVGVAGELPACRLGEWEPPAPATPVVPSWIDSTRGVIVAGAGAGDATAVGLLSDATGWPVLADPRSGCRGLPGAVLAFDALLRTSLATSHRPSVVVHLGEPPTSKVLAEWSASLACTQARVVGVERTIDPSCTVGEHLVGDVAAFCSAAAGERTAPVDAGWLASWLQAERAAQRAITATLKAASSDGSGLTEPEVARVIGGFEGRVVAASSMPIRDIEWYGAAHPHGPVLCNRGANGIDGTIATAIGVALATGEPTALLIGDIALLHDSPSLAALVRRDADLRIVVVDNDGGGIFSFLPQATALQAGRFETVFGTPHGTDVVALAHAHHIEATTVTTTADLLAALAASGPRLIRVPTDRAANVEVHRRLNAAVADAVAALTAP